MTKQYAIVTEAHPSAEVIHYLPKGVLVEVLEGEDDTLFVRSVSECASSSVRSGERCVVRRRTQYVRVGNVLMLDRAACEAIKAELGE